MGVTRTEIFTDEQNQIATFAKVLGHPARIAIIQQLLKEESCICGEFVEIIGLSQPTISQHLKELKNLGIIRGNVSGTKVCYCLDLEKWLEVKELLSNFFNLPPGNQANCC